MKTHLHIISGSIKHREWGEILIDGKNTLSNKVTKRGINVLIMNEVLKPVSCRFYDFSRDDLNEIFTNDMKRVLNNSVVILLIKGDGTKKMTKITRQFIKVNMKSKYIYKVCKKQAWCYVVKKHDDDFHTVVEKYEEMRALINDFYDLTFETTLQKRLRNIQQVNYLFNHKLSLTSPIKLKTAQLKKKLKKIPIHDMASRLKLLYNQYKGATCYIISCGPSVNKYRPELIRRLAGHNLVFTVKQAYNMFRDISDFHLYNFCNLYNYNYPEDSNVITAYMSQLDTSVKRADLNFTLHKEYQINAIRPRESKYPPLSKLMNFEAFTFDKMISRPEGPGIMYELGIYMAVHLGVSEIVTLGWDVSYTLPNVVQVPTGPATEKIEDSHFYGSNSHTQKNIAKIITENEFIINSSKILNLWLKKRNIDLYIMSDLSKLDDSIPRIDPKKMFNCISTNKTNLINNSNPIHQNTDDEFLNYCNIDTHKNILDDIIIINDNSNTKEAEK